MGGHLDDELRARVRAVLSRRQTTEPELRKLVEEGDACERILRGRLEARERRLETLASDPASSLAEIVAELQSVRGLRAHVDELHGMLSELDGQARALRAGWLGGARERPGSEPAGV